MTAKEIYRRWLSEYADVLGLFTTLTFSRPVTKDIALRKGKCFGLNLNKSIFGNHFQRKGQGLVTFFSLEGQVKIKRRIANPHLHFLIEDHPKLTRELIENVWAKVAGRKAARIGVKVEPINSPKAVRDYITKEIFSWEHGPECYIPKAKLEKTENCGM